MWLLQASAGGWGGRFTWDVQWGTSRGGLPWQQGKETGRDRKVTDVQQRETINTSFTLKPYVHMWTYIHTYKNICPTRYRKFPRNKICFWNTHRKKKTTVFIVVLLWVEWRLQTPSPMSLAANPSAAGQEASGAGGRKPSLPWCWDAASVCVAEDGCRHGALYFL